MSEAVGAKKGEGWRESICVRISLSAVVFHSFLSGDAARYGAHAHRGAADGIAHIEQLRICDGAAGIQAGNGLTALVEHLGLRADSQLPEGVVGVRRVWMA